MTLVCTYRRSGFEFQYQHLSNLSYKMRERPNNLVIPAQISPGFTRSTLYVGETVHSEEKWATGKYCTCLDKGRAHATVGMLLCKPTERGYEKDKGTMEILDTHHPDPETTGMI